MKVRKWLVTATLVALAVALMGACGGDDDDDDTAGGDDDTTEATEGDDDAAASGEVFKVGINQYGTFDVLDQALAGIEDELAVLGYDESNIELDIQNPEFDSAANATIAQQFVDNDVDVMVGFATPPAQAMMSASSDIPIVFVASSTPVESELVASLEEPGGNVTGVADILPIEDEIDLMQQVMPDMQTVGLIWNSGDAGGQNLYNRARAHLEELGLDIVDAPITGSADTLTAAQSLVGQVDVIELPCDSETLAGVEAIITTATEAGIPVFGCTGEAVAAGAILAGAFDYEEVGREAARLIDKILKGEDPGTLPVVVPVISGIELNLTAAEALGLEIPADIEESAVKTY